MFRKLARPMLASVYVADGVDALRHVEEREESGRLVLERTRSLIPSQYSHVLPSDPQTMVRVLGGTKVAAGSLLALGKFQRLSAGLLALTTIPTLITRDAFWDSTEDDEKQKRKNGFLTNVALLGGLLITVSDTQGKPGLKWRTKHAAKVTSKKVSKALPGKSETEKYLEAGKQHADKLAGSAKEIAAAGAATATGFWDDKGKDFVENAADKAQEWLTTAQHTAAEYLGEGQKTAKKAVASAQHYIDDNKDDWLSFAESNAKAAKDRTIKAAKKAQASADAAAKKASSEYSSYSKKAAKASKKANKKATKARKKAIKRLQKKFDF